ncbi:MAG TPA: GNAT family N-acetyltransferase [Salinivirgaceae bacterium]|nr:GNAT family N-acetyltransferase [Salinivirgaceae bacterium]
MSNTEYRKFFSQIPAPPIFYEPWWLDSLCGSENWIGLVVQSGNVVKAVWPLQKTTYRFGRIYYSQPPFTPYLGILFNYPPEQKTCTRLAFEKDVVNEMLAQLGEFAHLGQTFHPSFRNWLPFYWNGFSQTTLYTYKIQNITNTDLVFRNFQENIRREIRKAQRLGVVVRQISDVDLIYAMLRKTMTRQAREMSFTKNTLDRLLKMGMEHSCLKTFGVFDAEEKCHAVSIIVWDKHTAYYLLGGGDPDLRNSGATSLLLWEAIRFASTKVQTFDFEGSMIEPIERFFRAFGAEQIDYFSISKTNKSEKQIQRLLKLKIRFLG